ncbi:hypothetical protein SMUG_02950 [Gallibacterium anatis]
MNLRDNGLFKFDYQFPVYNFWGCSRLATMLYYKNEDNIL